MSTFVYKYIFLFYTGRQHKERQMNPSKGGGVVTTGHSPSSIQVLFQNICPVSKATNPQKPFGK